MEHFSFNKREHEYDVYSITVKHKMYETDEKERYIRSKIHEESS